MTAGLPPLSRTDGVDRRVLLAERDAARAERRVREAQDETAALASELALSQAQTVCERQRVEALKAELARLYASSSWRWSAPVRAASFAVQRVRGLLGGPPPRLPLGPQAPACEPPPPVVLTLREDAILARLRRRG